MGVDPLLDFPRTLGFENAEARALDGTRLRFVHGGRAGACRVLLLHGAPQMSYTWRKVMPLLADRYRVIVPDLRGYGLSEIPASGRYDLDILAADIDAVLTAALRPGEAEEAPFSIVAHDWGGPIAFHFAEQHPARLRHLLAVNAPHPTAYARELFTPGQALRSWYVALFQLPGLERLLETTDARLLLWMMRASSPEGLFGKDEIEVYRKALCRPGRAEAVLAYYREAFRGNPLEKRRAMLARPMRIEVPVTVLWGDDDKCLAPSHPDATRPYCVHFQQKRLSGVSHWVPEERPHDVAQALIEGDEAA